MNSSAPARAIHELRARRHRLLADLSLPRDGLPGSLVLTHRRCGSLTCHCHDDEDGHPSWTLTFMANGTKRVVHVPGDTVDDVQQRVAAGNAFKSGVAELMAINAQLMVLERQVEKQSAAAARKRRAR
jgi:hypothetical protein